MTTPAPTHHMDLGVLREPLPHDTLRRLGAGMCEAVGKPVFWERSRVFDCVARKPGTTLLCGPPLEAARGDWAVLDGGGGQWRVVILRPSERVREWYAAVETEAVARGYAEGWRFEPQRQIWAAIDAGTEVRCGRLVAGSGVEAVQLSPHRLVGHGTRRVVMRAERVAVTTGESHHGGFRGEPWGQCAAGAGGPSSRFLELEAR